MKNLFLLSLVIPLMPVHAASMKPAVFKNTLERLYAEQSEKIQQCNNQNQSVIKKAYRPLDKPQNGEELVKFEEDEKKALEYMDGLDVGKIFIETEENADNLYFTNCSEKNITIFDELNLNRALCSNFEDEANFMKGLVYATKNYSWTPETKDKAKKLILRYINFATAVKDSPLMGKITVTEILSEMVKYNLISADFSSDIQKLKEKASQPMPKKKKSLADLKPCAMIIAKRKYEINVSNEIGKEVQELLKKIL